MNDNSDTFLELFKLLEDLLAKKYIDNPRRHSSVVIEFLNDPESLPCRTELDLCREVRNLLSHQPERDGEPVIQPSNGLLNDLRGIIDYVTKPPLALAYATPADKVLMAGLNDKVLALMRKMHDRGYSHVPVIEGGRFYGVFSKSLVFTYVLNARDYKIDKDVKVHAFKRYLPISSHDSEKYMFVPPDYSVVEIKQAFEDMRDRSRKLAAIFVTEDGSPDTRLMGIITPWDLLEKKVNINMRAGT